MSLDKLGEIGYNTKRMVQESRVRSQGKTWTMRQPGRAGRQTSLLPLDKMSLGKEKGKPSNFRN